MSESGLSVVGWLQVTAASLLGLRFQLDEIAYGASNFRHADLSVSELQAIMAAKQENFFTLFVAMASAQLASEHQKRITENLPASSFTTMALLSALRSEDRSQAVKHLLGRELGRSGSIAIDPAMESGLTLLGDRNEAALSALRDVLEQDQARTIVCSSAPPTWLASKESSLLGSWGLNWKNGSGWRPGKFHRTQISLRSPTRTAH